MVGGVSMAKTNDRDVGDIGGYGKSLDERLRKLEWSQAELARRSGLSVAAISRAISGQRKNLRSDTVTKIESALHLANSGLYNDELDRFLMSDIAREMRLTIDEVRHLRAFVWWTEDERPTLQAWADFARARRGLLRNKE